MDLVVAVEGVVLVVDVVVVGLVVAVEGVLIVDGTAGNVAPHKPQVFGHLAATIRSFSQSVFLRAHSGPSGVIQSMVGPVAPCCPATYRVLTHCRI